MNARSRERLLRLADLLDTVPAQHFDLAVWAESEKPCETAGCAVGWAASDPWFRRRGLRLNEFDEPEFRNKCWGFMAATEFFAVGYDEAVQLFSPTRYPEADHTRPKAVAKRIRKFVEDAA